MTSISSNKVSASELSMEVAKKAGKQKKAQEEKSIFNECDPTAPTSPGSIKEDSLEVKEEDKGFFKKIINNIKNFFSGGNKAENKEADSTKEKDKTDKENTIIGKDGKEYREIEVTEYLEDGVIEVTKELEEVKEKKEEAKTHEETVTITIFEDGKVTDILIETREVPNDTSEIKKEAAEATDIVYPTEPSVVE